MKHFVDRCLLENKKVLRSLVFVIKGPVKQVFSTFPQLERASRALLHRLPRLASAFLLALQAPARKIFLSPKASLILRDLQSEIAQQRIKRQ
jgi:hypothetical protein